MNIGSVANSSARLPPANAAAGGVSNADGFAALLNESSATPSPSTSASDDGLGSASTDPAQAFLNYMKETPAQQLEDQWLASHHLTRKQLEAMSPEQRHATEKQMAADIKQKLKEEAQKKLGTQVDLLA